MGISDAELRLLLRVRPMLDPEATFEEVASRFHEQVRELGGRLLGASPVSLTFDFSLNLRDEVWSLCESLESDKRVSATLLEAELRTFARGDNWAGSVSPSLSELERVGQFGQGGAIVVPTSWKTEAPALWERISSSASVIEGDGFFIVTPRAAPATGRPAVESVPLSRMFGSDVSGDDLRRLKLEKQKSKESGGSPLCKAALALGLGLSRSGRHREAAFEVLEGLSHARRVEDSAGEKACAAFLSQVARHEGDVVSSDAWGRLAQE